MTTIIELENRLDKFIDDQRDKFADLEKRFEGLVQSVNNLSDRIAPAFDAAPLNDKIAAVELSVEKALALLDARSGDAAAFERIENELARLSDKGEGVISAETAEWLALILDKYYLSDKPAPKTVITL